MGKKWLLLLLEILLIWICIITPIWAQENQKVESQGNINIQGETKEDEELSSLSEENKETADGIVYKVLANEESGEQYCNIIQYNGDVSELIIPSQIDGIPVKRIEGLRNKSGDGENIKVLTISEGVEEAAISVFSELRNLEKIDLPSSFKGDPVGIDYWGNRDNWTNYVSIRGTKITDLSGFSKVTQVKNIDISYLTNEKQGLTSLDGIESLVDLKNVLANINPDLTDISAVKNLKKLKYLRLSYTNVSDLTSLNGSPELKMLGMDGTPVSDVSPLANCPKLWSLNFGLCKNLTDISTLSNLPIDEIGVDDSGVSDENLLETVIPDEIIVDSNKKYWSPRVFRDTKFSGSIENSEIAEASFIDGSIWTYIGIEGQSIGTTTMKVNYGTATKTVKVIVNEGFDLGDVNADHLINASDALQDLRHSVKEIVLEEKAFIRGDVNEDEIINASDALQILRYSVKEISSFW